MKFFYRFFPYIIILPILVILFHTPIQAQKFPTPDGELTLRKAVTTYNGVQIRLTATANTLYTAKYISGLGWDKSKELFVIPIGRTVVDMSFKFGDGSDKRPFYLLLDNGSIYTMVLNLETNTLEGKPVLVPGPVLTGQISSRKVIGGDKLYLLLNSRLWANKLDGTGWVIDSAGIATININDFIINPQNVKLAATNKGVYFKLENGTTWTKMLSLDSLNCSTIFQKRYGSLHLGAANRGIYYSTDQGASWVLDTAGFATAGVSRFGDDVFGTLYGISTNQGVSSLYRKFPGGSSWERIDTNLRKLTQNTFRIYDVGGDSTLEAATTYSNFFSLDSGITWLPSHKGIMSEEIYGLAFLPDKIVVSTSLGIFVRESFSTTSAWEKTYPQSGYLGSRILRRDASNNVYTQEATSGFGNRQPNTLISRDQGLTWRYDTLGLSNVPAGGGFFASVFYVDPAAGQHYGISASGNSPVRVFTKTGVNPWAVDTNGAGLTSARQGQFKILSSFGSDSRDNLFFSTIQIDNNQYSTCILYKRPQTGDSWSLDSAGLENAGIISLSPDKNGKMYAGTVSKGNLAYIYRKLNDKWEKIEVPPAATSDAKSIAIDSNNILYASFGPYFSGSNKGCYMTKDGGANWDYAGLDSLNVRGLVVRNDSAFAFTSRGVWKLTPQPKSAPKMTLSTKILNFGKIQKGSFKASIVKFSNVGNDTLRVTNITSNNTAFKTDTARFNVAPGKSMDVVVRFDPTGNGSHNGTMRVSSNTYPDSIVVMGEGFGFKYPKMVLGLTIIDFGQVVGGTSKDTTLSISNQGEDTLKINRIVSFSPSFVAKPDSIQILPGESAQLKITFTPAQNGNIISKLQLTGNMPLDSINVWGEGIDVPVPEIQWGQDMLDFGIVDIGKTKDSTVVINNIGKGDLYITNVRVNSQVFAVIDAPDTVKAGGSEMITVRFTPATTNLVTARVRITSNAPNDSVVVRGQGNDASSVEDPDGWLSYLEVSPNPTTGESSIIMNLTAEGNYRIILYDLRGEEIAVLADGHYLSGKNVLRLGLQDPGLNLSNGLYFIRLIGYNLQISTGFFLMK